MMTCNIREVCPIRFRRGEIACATCRRPVTTPDPSEDDAQEDDESYDEAVDDDDIDDDDVDDSNDDGDLVGYTTQPDGKFGEIMHYIKVNGHHVPGFCVTVTEDGWDNEYVLVVEDTPGDIHDDVHYDIDSEVSRYVRSSDSLYDVLEEITGRVIKLK